MIGLVSGGVAMAAVIALVVGFVVVPAFTGEQQTIYSDKSALYDYTDPMLGLERNHQFEIDVDYDLDAINAAHAPAEDPSDPDSSRGANDWALEVYYDSALTKKARFSAFQLDPGDEVTISGDEMGEAYGENPGQIADAGDAISSWGMHEKYYLVSRVEKDGTEREKPLVTEFTVQPSLDAPDVTFGKAAEDGTISLSWTPVEGAARYLVVTHEVTDDGRGTWEILDRVDGTEWSSAGAIEDYEVKEAPFISEQNVGLDSYSYRGLTEDQVAGGYDQPESEEEIAASTLGYDIGVIATDGQRYSSFPAYDMEEVAGWLPREVAFNTASALKNWGASGYIEGIENVQKVLPFTSVDGRTRSTVAYIDESVILDYGDRWIVPLRGRNTQLGEWIPITKRSMPDPAAAIAQFNAAALAAAPPTGMPRFDEFVAPEMPDSEPVSETPQIDYPVFGSSDFVTFLAAHLVAQTSLIDISAYVDAPGAPDPYDAIEEAREQNPYAFNISNYSLRDGGDTMLVTYTLPTEEVQTMQANLKQRVDEVVSSVVSDGMSDREKVTALNGWLVDNAEYDYAAFNSLLDVSYSGIPAGHENAWNATGTLLQGIGVCASYAYAFNVLANAAGVKTIVVSGDVFSGGPHAWNKVFVDGQWLAVDPTWNDGGDPSQYLMIPDSGFTGTAARAEDASWMVDSLIPSFATP
ncbi:transglutaminase domain-containing protein [Cnuibacter sp. UC19_7]|uniref:transglutaminase domain-containing protein n=1 Tax=Cnuibacter sp. UC19_7 TaxID=3350166 RepID=UPI003672A703